MKRVITLLSKAHMHSTDEQLWHLYGNVCCKKCTNTTAWFLVFLISFFLASCTDEHETMKPSLQSLTESVYASATVQPDSLYAVYAAVGGIVDERLVEDGDIVKKGDRLVKIVNKTPALNSENAKLAFDLSKKNYNGQSAILKELSQDVSSAAQKFENDSILYDQQKRLWDKGIGSKLEFDSRRLAYEVSRNNFNAANNRLQRTRLELKTQMEQAENNYQSSLIQIEDYTVKSTLNGRVYEVMKDPGEFVSSLEPIAFIGSQTRFMIDLLVDEVDIARVRLSQQVLLVLDAYGDQVFTARIKKISPRMDDRSRTFLIEAAFDQQPAVLYSGLTGEANIIIDKKDDVLTIPLSYLQEGNKVKTKKGMQTVEVGLKNLEFVEIISGLDTNSILIKPE